MTYLTLLSKRAEDISGLFSADSSLSTIDKQSHINAIVGDRHMGPVAGQVGSVGVDGGDLMRPIRFEREEEARIPVAMFANRLETKQPSPIARGIETLIKEACVRQKK